MPIPILSQPFGRVVSLMTERAGAVRLGVWGAGGMGERVVRTASTLPGVEVAAVLDRDRSRADAIARSIDAVASDDLAEACADAGLDAVYIGLPNAAHRGACLEAARLGLHVLVDKPLTTHPADADEVLLAAGATDTFWMMGFSTRFRAEWRRARELVIEGVIGDPYLITDTVIEAYRSTPDWYWSQEAGGGTLQLQSHHVFDRWEWLLGLDVEELSARVMRPRSLARGDTELSVALQARLGDSVLGLSALSFGLGFDAAPHLSLVVQGTHGMIEIDGDRRLTVSTAEGTVEERYEGNDWLALELEHFVAGIRGEMLDQPTLAVGRRAVVLAGAAERSAATELWVGTRREAAS